MRVVEARAPARVALAGNPSDAYHGRTLALAIANHTARVTVCAADELEIAPAEPGAERLLAATVERFAGHCAELGAEVGPHSFSIDCETDIPRAVGLGGSSAIVTAALTALARWCAVGIEPARLAELALSVETRALRIPAGLQDRVAQAYGGLVYMDFDPALAAGAGEPYERLDPGRLPRLFVAHLASAGQPSHVFHSRLRERYEAGEPEVIAAMSRLPALATAARGAVLAGDSQALGDAMDASFDARRSIAELDPAHVGLVELARSLGSAANFAGSGGAIVGIARDADHLAALRSAFAGAGGRLELCRPAPGAAAREAIGTPG